jgi:hypothetical protein
MKTLQDILTAYENNTIISSREDKKFVLDHGFELRSIIKPNYSLCRFDSTYDYPYRYSLLQDPVCTEMKGVWNSNVRFTISIPENLKIKLNMPKW